MASAITKEEQEERRQAVITNRADFQLEGREEPPEIALLCDQFIAGTLTPAEFRVSCFAFAKGLAVDPEWAPATPALPK